MKNKKCAVCGHPEKEHFKERYGCGCIHANRVFDTWKNRYRYKLNCECKCFVEKQND